MLIRDATPEDAEVLARLHHDSAFAAYASIYGPGWEPRPFEQRLATWQRNLEPGSGVDTLVCMDADAIVGLSGFGPNRDGLGAETGELYTLYVHPRRFLTGIGTLLLHATEARLKQRGFTLATLWTLELNERARRFYERYGWRTDGATLPDEGHPEILQVRYRKQMGESR